MDFLEFLTGLIIGSSVGAFTVYSKAYLKEKAKNKAIVEDNKKLLENQKELEQEKQKIILQHQKELELEKSSHQKDLEKEKNNHQLDFEKRKHQYESKKKQYYSFMEELDSFQACSLDVINNDLSKVMMLYYQRLKGLNQLSVEDLTIQYNENAQNIANKIREQKAKLYSQHNALKLSTKDSITKILEELINEIEKSEQVFIQLSKYIESPTFQTNPNTPKEIINIANQNESNIHLIKEKIINAMKLDLDNL